MTPRAPQIAALAAAIGDIRLLPAPADAMLHTFFRRHPALGRQDRAFVSEGVFAWLRRRRSLEALAGTLHPAKLALATAVRERGLSIRDLEGALTSADAQWVRDFKARLSTELPPAVAADVPDWLWERLGAAFGEEERLALARAWLSPAPLDLRVNTLKLSRDEARAQLAAAHRPGGRAPWRADGRRRCRCWP
jgi:16S rRNA (cytosine967-C5)-methyltransferase